MSVIERPVTRPSYPLYASLFAAMHDAMRRDANRLVAAVEQPHPNIEALAAWFGRFEAVIVHHHDCEDEIVWPGLEAIVAAGDCSDEGAAFLAARGRLLDEHHDLDAAMVAVHASFAAGASADDRRTAAQSFTERLHSHLEREEAALFPLLDRHVSEDQFRVLEHAVVKATPFSAITFTGPWILDGASDALIEMVRQEIGLVVRIANRVMMQPRYRRLVNAAFGEDRS